MPLIAGSPSRIEPTVIETFGVPEIYADGAVHHIRENVMECICYRAYIVEGTVELREVARVIFPLNGFDRSLVSAYQMRTGGNH